MVRAQLKDFKLKIVHKFFDYVVINCMFTDVLKESLKRASEKEKKISEDLKAYREKLTSANKDKLSLTVN